MKRRTKTSKTPILSQVSIGHRKPTSHPTHSIHMATPFEATHCTTPPRDNCYNHRQLLQLGTTATTIDSSYNQGQLLQLGTTVTTIDSSYNQGQLLQLGTGGGTKSLIFHVTFAHTNPRHRIPIRVIGGVSLYSCCVETKKWRDPQGISSSNAVVFIANHIHIVFEWGSLGITLENRRRRLLCKVNGHKSDDSAFFNRARDPFVPPLN